MVMDDIIPEPQDESQVPQAELDDDFEEDGDSQEEEVDYRALYEAEKARAEKAENDRKAALGSQRSQRERDEQMTGMQDTLDALAKTVGLLVKANGDYGTDLEAELAKVQEDIQGTSATRAFDRQYAAIHENLSDVLTGEDGEALVDLNAYPEWVRDWHAAVKDRDVATLARLSIEAQTYARKAEREKNRTLLEQAKKDSQAAKKNERRRKADMDLGASASGGADRKLSGTDLIAKGLSERPDLITKRSLI